MTRIVFMGTPEFAVPDLKALIDAYNVVGVVTQPDRPAGRGRQLRPSPVKKAAQAAGLPLYQPASLRREETAEPIRNWQPDLIVVAAFGQILRPHLLNLPPLGCLNVHASLLPRWRGASPIQHAILAGDTSTGISLMQMDEGLDTGPVYVREAIPIHADETAATLHDRLADLGAAMLSQYLDEIIDGRLTPQSQDDSQATYAPLITKDAGELNWQESAAALDRRIRAMTPWPGAFTWWDGQLLKIKTAVPLPTTGLIGGTPGQVVPGPIDEESGEETAVVLTGAGGLQLQTIQLAGKKEMAMSDFLRGRPDFIGDILGKPGT
jgi:methionyl-tRNA formyltransferase